MPQQGNIRFQIALTICGYNREVGTGGDGRMAFNSYVSGNGPVLEKNMPFTNVGKKISLSNIQNKKPAIKITDFVLLPSNRDTIKQHIIANGAVSSSTCASSKDLLNYYNTSTKSYYYDGNSQYTNHAISIIGWDDNYDKNNFNVNHRPKNNGAYLVLNSSGTGFGNNGCYYISYEDPFIEYNVTGIENTGSVNYDNIYQHDPYGMNCTMKGYETIYAANVFTKDINSIEELTEVSIATFADVNCTVYVNSVDGNLSLSQLKQVSTAKQLTPGYHTIKLICPVTLAGSKFVVAVKYEPVNGITCVTMESPDGALWKYAKTKVGESFLINASSGSYVDLKTYPEGYAIDANVCIKAFTKTIKPAKPTLTIKKPSSTSIKNSWKKIAGASGYTVYIATDKSTYKKVKTITKGSTISYTKTKLKKGHTYKFKIRAYKTVNGKKVYSNYSSVKSKKL